MKKDYSAGISMFFKVFAVLTFVAAIVLGFVLGRVPGHYRSELYFPLMLAYWVSGLVSGMIMLAISKILDNQIEIKRKLDSIDIKPLHAAAHNSIESQNHTTLPRVTTEFQNHITLPQVTNVGTCEMCGKEKVMIYHAKIEDSFGVDYKLICKECVKKTHSTVFD